MPLTLGILGYEQDNGQKLRSENGENSAPALQFPKLTSKDLLQRIKNIDQVGSDKNVSFSIQQSSYQSTINCFQLLVDLTNYSHEMFSDLSRLMLASQYRITNVSKRVEQLQAMDIENRVAEAELVSPPISVVSPDANAVNNDITQFQSAPYKFTLSLIDRHQLSLSLLRNLGKLRPNPDFSALQSHVEEKVFRNMKAKYLASRYSAPQFFLNAWMAAQERRLDQLEVEKKQHKADRKKREKVKAHAQSQQFRKSEIQVVRWKDRYTGDGRSRSNSQASNSSKTIHSQIQRRQMRSLEYDNDDDNSDTESTKTGTTTTMPTITEEAIAALKATSPKEADNHTTTAEKSPGKSERPPLPPSTLSASTSNHAIPKTSSVSKLFRSDSIASDMSDSVVSPPPARPQLTGIFPNQPPPPPPPPARSISRDEDEDDDRSDIDDNDTTNMQMVNQDLNKSKDSVESDISDLTFLSNQTLPKRVLPEEEVIPLLYAAMKDLTIDVNDPTVFVSPSNFLVIPTEVMASQFSRQSVNLRCSNVYGEKGVSERVNPAKTTIENDTKPKYALQGPPGPPVTTATAKPPPPAMKKGSSTEGIALAEKATAPAKETSPTKEGNGSKPHPDERRVNFAPTTTTTTTATAALPPKARSPSPAPPPPPPPPSNNNTSTSKMSLPSTLQIQPVVIPEKKEGDDENRLFSPLNRGPGTGRRLATKSVRLNQGGQNNNFADILATSAVKRPPPPPPPPPPKKTVDDLLDTHSVVTVVDNKPTTTASSGQPPAPPPPPAKTNSGSGVTTIRAPTPPPAPPAPRTSPNPPPPAATATSTATEKKEEEAKLTTPVKAPLPATNNETIKSEEPTTPNVVSPSSLPNLSPLTDASSETVRPNLLNAIRKGSILKKVSTEEINQNASFVRRNSSLGAFGSNAVNAILERRRFVDTESDSDSDENNEDWD